MFGPTLKKNLSNVEGLRTVEIRYIFPRPAQRLDWPVTLCALLALADKIIVTLCTSNFNKKIYI